MNMFNLREILRALPEDWVKVGEYEFHREKEVGRGNFGAVYEGRAQKNTAQKVAVKVIKNNSSPNLKREIDVLQEISRLNHANFVQLLHSEESPGAIILVMEFCDEDLATYIGKQKHKRLPETTVAFFSRQLVKGLKALKANKIIHRDLKPHNVLLSYTVQNPKPENIIVKIADFGLARFQLNYVQQLSQCGTIVYMAPEALTSKNYGSKVDIWSVGVIMHEMVFGSLPFQEQYSQAINNYKCFSSASQPLQDLLNSMLKKDPIERIDLQSLAYHPFLLTPRQMQLLETKKEYLPQQMPRSEKRKLYSNAVTLQSIPTWHDSVSMRSGQIAAYGTDNELNKKVSVWAGDITKLEVDAIVNPSNEDLVKGDLSGANKVIHEAAGPLLEQETTGLIGGCAFGSAEVSAGYHLPADYVIHTVGPSNSDANVLSSCYDNCLQRVLDNKIKTVAFPAIATGNFGFPIDEATRITLKSVREWLSTGNNRTQMDRIIFVAFTPEAVEAYKKHMPAFFPKV